MFIELSLADQNMISDICYSYTKYYLDIEAFIQKLEDTTPSIEGNINYFPSGLYNLHLFLIFNNIDNSDLTVEIAVNNKNGSSQIDYIYFGYSTKSRELCKGDLELDSLDKSVLNKLYSIVNKNINKYVDTIKQLKIKKEYKKRKK